MAPHAEPIGVGSWPLADSTSTSGQKQYEEVRQVGQVVHGRGGSGGASRGPNDGLRTDPRWSAQERACGPRPSRAGRGDRRVQVGEGARGRSRRGRERVDADTKGGPTCRSNLAPLSLRVADPLAGAGGPVHGRDAMRSSPALPSSAGPRV